MRKCAIAVLFEGTGGQEARMIMNNIEALCLCGKMA
jgi:hypothetical protein